jgi:hypothetical protein
VGEFTEFKQGPDDDEFQGYNGDIPSRAVVASDGKGRGAVIWWVGLAFWIEIQEYGVKDLDDLGLDDAPAGLSIWEGQLHSRQCGNPLDGIDYETELVGTFREPTKEEWEEIQDGSAPWDEREWWIKKCPA